MDIDRSGEGASPISRNRREVRPFFHRVLVIGTLWIVLTGADARTWGLAVVVIVLAAYASLRSVPPGAFQLRPAGVLRFLPFFLLYSARGGADVARRAIHRPAVLNAGTVRFRTTLPDGVPRYFFAAVMGLLPGTLTAHLEGDHLSVHVLDRAVDVEGQLRRLERRVADLFALEIGP